MITAERLPRTHVTTIAETTIPPHAPKSVPPATPSSCNFRRGPPSPKRKKSRHDCNSQRRSQWQSSRTLRGKWHKIRPGTQPKRDGPKYQSPEHEKFNHVNP